MATLYDEGDHYSLTKIDIRVLLALLGGPLNGYEVARQCERDHDWGNRPVNIGSVQHSIKSMLALMLIKELPGRTDGPGKPSRTFKITTVGRQVLGWEVETMKHQLELIEERSESAKKRP